MDFALDIARPLGHEANLDSTRMTFAVHACILLLTAYIITVATHSHLDSHCGLSIRCSRIAGDHHNYFHFSRQYSYASARRPMKAKALGVASAGGAVVAAIRSAYVPAGVLALVSVALIATRGGIEGNSSEADESVQSRA